MNLLNLISPWVDIICEVTMKCTTVLKSKFFHQLNTLRAIANDPCRSENWAQATDTKQLNDAYKYTDRDVHAGYLDA